MAKLHFVYGCMGSGKSLRLLALAHNLKEKEIPHILLKPSKDTRDGVGTIRSRSGMSMPCKLIDEDSNIKAIISVLSPNEPTWVLVDECQFLSEEQVDQLCSIVDNERINVMCYGLRTDFMSHVFPGSKRLFEVADEIEEVKSYCKCGQKKATINARVDGSGNVLTNGEQVLVGGDDKYVALCRKCWKKAINNETSH